MEFPWFILIFGAGVILLACWIAAIPVPVHKQLIIETLQKKGTKDIHVTWDWKTTGQGMHSYKVSYEDRKGRSHHTTCIVTNSQDIYWKDEE